MKSFEEIGKLLDNVVKTQTQKINNLNVNNIILDAKKRMSKISENINKSFDEIKKELEQFKPSIDKDNNLILKIDKLQGSNLKVNIKIEKDKHVKSQHVINVLQNTDDSGSQYSYTLPSTAKIKQIKAKQDDEFIIITVPLQ